MLKRFKKYITEKKSAIKNNAYLGSFKTYLRDPSLWRFDRRAVALGVAVGLFCAFIPLVPFQTLIAILFSLLIRSNLIVAFMVSWVSNPLTFVPIAYFTYRTGHLILGGNNVHGYLFQYGKTYVTGLIAVSIGAALMGYVITLICWYSVVFLKQFWRKKK